MEKKAETGRCFTVPVKIKDLVPANYNPRTMGDKQRQGLSNSIGRFGLVQPIVWNQKTNNIVGGHQRLYDLIQKGATVTDVVIVNLSETEEKALNIALNHKGIQGEFIENELKTLLQDIQTQDKEILEELNLSDITLGDEWEDDLQEAEELPTEADASNNVVIKITIPAGVKYVAEEVKDEINKLILNHFDEMGIQIT